MSFNALTIPNILTLGRMVLTVFFFSAGLQNDWPWALSLFVAAAITDLIDGTIARLLNQKTRFGAFIDPMADKLMMLAGVSLLTIHGTITWWLMALIVGKDLYVVLGLAYLWQRGVAAQPQPTVLSKFTTLSQMLTISFGFAQATIQAAYTLPSWIHTIIQALPWIVAVACLFTLATAVQYTIIGWRMLNSVPPAPR